MEIKETVIAKVILKKKLTLHNFKTYLSYSHQEMQYRWNDRRKPIEQNRVQKETHMNMAK